MPYHRVLPCSTTAIPSHTSPNAIPLGENADYCQCPGGKDVQNDGHAGPSTCAECLRLVAPANPLIPIANQTVPSDEDVYTAFKQVFSPHLKKKKKIPKLSPRLITAYKDREDIGRLIDQYGESAICTSVRGLVRSKVFTSDVKAAALFPKLFPTLPVDGQEREDPDAETEAIALKGAVPVRPTEDSSGHDLVDGITSM